MPKGQTLPPGPSLYPECYREGTSGERRHWAEGTVTCERCRAQQRIKVQRYRRNSARLGTRTIPALGTQRRIRALCRWGFTYGDIGARLGITHSAVGRIAQQEVCFADTAARIARVYRELVEAGKPGTSTQTQRRAIAAGWAGPMDWDDIDTDEVPLSEIERCHTEAIAIEKNNRRLERLAALSEEERERTRAAHREYLRRRRSTEREAAAA